jgi:hypothetical protein
MMIFSAPEGKFRIQTTGCRYDAPIDNVMKFLSLFPLEKCSMDLIEKVIEYRLFEPHIYAYFKEHADRFQILEKYLLFCPFYQNDPIGMLRAISHIRQDQILQKSHELIKNALNTHGKTQKCVQILVMVLQLYYTHGHLFDSAIKLSEGFTIEGVIWILQMMKCTGTGATVVETIVQSAKKFEIQNYEIEMSTAVRFFSPDQREEAVPLVVEWFTTVTNDFFRFKRDCPTQDLRDVVKITLQIIQKIHPDHQKSCIKHIEKIHEKNKLPMLKMVESLIPLLDKEPWNQVLLIHLLEDGQVYENQDWFRYIQIAKDLTPQEMPPFQNQCTIIKMVLRLADRLDLLRPMVEILLQDYLEKFVNSKPIFLSTESIEALDIFSPQNNILILEILLFELKVKTIEALNLLIPNLIWAFINHKLSVTEYLPLIKQFETHQAQSSFISILNDHENREEILEQLRALLVNKNSQEIENILKAVDSIWVSKRIDLIKKASPFLKKYKLDTAKFLELWFFLVKNKSEFLIYELERFFPQLKSSILLLFFEIYSDLPSEERKDEAQKIINFLQAFPNPSEKLIDIFLCTTNENRIEILNHLLNLVQACDPAEVDSVLTFLIVQNKDMLELLQATQNLLHGQRLVEPVNLLKQIFAFQVENKIEKFQKARNIFKESSAKQFPWIIEAIRIVPTDLLESLQELIVNLFKAYQKKIMNY